MEVYKGKPIIYGAGGFLDDYALDEQYRNDLGAVWVVRFRGKDLTAVEALPIKISHHWRQGLSKPPGQGMPAYLSQVGLRAQLIVCFIFLVLIDQRQALAY